MSEPEGVFPRTGVEYSEARSAGVFHVFHRSYVEPIYDEAARVLDSGVAFQIPAEAYTGIGLTGLRRVLDIADENYRTQQQTIPVFGICRDYTANQRYNNLVLSGNNPFATTTALEAMEPGLGQSFESMDRLKSMYDKMRSGEITEEEWQAYQETWKEKEEKAKVSRDAQTKVHQIVKSMTTP